MLANKFFVWSNMFSTVDLCVLCLRYDETRKSIVSKDNSGIIIKEKCRFILNENINIRSEVSYICLHCLKNLNYVYKFKQMCLQNIKKFNNYIDTLETKKYLKVTLTDLQYQKQTELMRNNESTKEISSSIDVVIKKEIADNCVFQDGNVFKEEEEAMDENDEFSSLEKPENMYDNMQYSSSLNEEHHMIENFLKRVKKETEFTIIAEEIQIKDECLSEATDSDSEDISNNKLLNEGTNKQDHFNDEFYSEHSTANDDKNKNNFNDEFDSEHSTANDEKNKNCNSIFSEGGKNRENDQNVDNAKRLKCDKCRKAFTRPSSLKKHNCIHSGEKPHECDVCNKKFTTKSNLTVHKRTHNNERPYKCQVCQYKCAKTSDLKRHMRVHTGEKPFQCQICQYKGKETGSLKRHMRTHTGEKPIHCKICQYKCAQAGSLKKHMQIHTGEKPIHCQVCQYKCAQTGHLKKHMQKHSGEKPFTCKHCQKAFSESRNLKHHMQKRHTDKI